VDAGLAVDDREREALEESRGQPFTQIFENCYAPVSATTTNRPNPTDQVTEPTEPTDLTKRGTG
jgi:hypothetical protein